MEKTEYFNTIPPKELDASFQERAAQYFGKLQQNPTLGEGFSTFKESLKGQSLPEMAENTLQYIEAQSQKREILEYLKYKRESLEEKPQAWKGVNQPSGYSKGNLAVIERQLFAQQDRQDHKADSPWQRANVEDHKINNVALGTALTAEYKNIQNTVQQANRLTDYIADRMEDTHKAQDVIKSIGIANQVLAHQGDTLIQAPSVENILNAQKPNQPMDNEKVSVIMAVDHARSVITVNAVRGERQDGNVARVGDDLAKKCHAKLGGLSHALKAGQSSEYIAKRTELAVKNTSKDSATLPAEQQADQRFAQMVYNRVAEELTGKKITESNAVSAQDLLAQAQLNAAAKIEQLSLADARAEAQQPFTPNTTEANGVQRWQEHLKQLSVKAAEAYSADPIGKRAAFQQTIQHDPKLQAQVEEQIKAVFQQQEAGLEAQQNRAGQSTSPCLDTLQRLGVKEADHFEEKYLSEMLAHFKVENVGKLVEQANQKGEEVTGEALYAMMQKNLQNATTRG